MLVDSQLKWIQGPFEGLTADFVSSTNLKSSHTNVNSQNCLIFGSYILPSPRQIINSAKFTRTANTNTIILTVYCFPVE